MKLWLTRQSNGLYMLTALEPVIFPLIDRPDIKDAYIQMGEPVGLRNLCDRVLVLFDMKKPLARGQSVQVELSGTLLPNQSNQNNQKTKNEESPE